jgi:hypothetical protein
VGVGKTRLQSWRNINCVKDSVISCGNEQKKNVWHSQNRTPAL